MSDRNEAATHDPTAQRLRHARQSGQFAKSRELATSLTWLGGLALLVTLGAMLWNSMSSYAGDSWGQTDVTVVASQRLRASVEKARSIFWSALFPILGGASLVAILAWAAQSGFRVLPHLAVPDPGRLSPIRNIRQITGSEQLVSVLLGLAKFLLLAGVAIWILFGEIETLAEMARGPLTNSIQPMSDWLVSVVQRLCLAALVVGVLDYGIRWQLNRRALRMTDQEIRDEQQSMEPSPEVNAQRRLMQRRQ